MNEGFGDAWRAPTVDQTYGDCIAPALREASAGQFGSIFLDAMCTATAAGSCTFTIEVTNSMCNLMGNLHGGASMTIVDIFSSLALRTLDERISVSVSMAHQFSSPAMVGETIEIVSIVEKRGRQLAFTRVDIYNMSRGPRRKLVMQGLHTKCYISPAKL
jgi:acyl-coenzyme A thioesterase PaaI-like protein